MWFFPLLRGPWSLTVVLHLDVQVVADLSSGSSGALARLSYGVARSSPSASFCQADAFSLTGASPAHDLGSAASPRTSLFSRRGAGARSEGLLWGVRGEGFADPLRQSQMASVY